MKRMAAQTAVNGRDAFTIFFRSHPLTLAVVYSAIPKGGVNMPIMTLTTMTTPICTGLTPMLEKIGTKIGAKSTNWAESEIHMPLNRQNTLKINSRRYGEIFAAVHQLLIMIGTLSIARIQLMTEEKPMIKKMEVLPLAVDFRAAQMSAAFNLCDIRISSNRT